MGGEAESLAFPCLDVGCGNSPRAATARPALPGGSGEGDPTAAAAGGRGQHGAPGAANGARGAARRLTHSPVAAAGVDLGERGGAAGLQRGRSAVRSQQSQQSQQRQRTGPPGAAAAHPTGAAFPARAGAGAASLPAPPSSRTPLRAGPRPASRSGSGCGWAERCLRRRRRPPFIRSRDRERAELPRLTPPHGAGAAAAPGPPCRRPASGGGGCRRGQPGPPRPPPRPGGLPAGGGFRPGVQPRRCPHPPHVLPGGRPGAARPPRRAPGALSGCRRRSAGSRAVAALVLMETSPKTALGAVLTISYVCKPETSEEWVFPSGPFGGRGSVSAGPAAAGGALPQGPEMGHGQRKWERGWPWHGAVLPSSARVLMCMY